MIRTSFQRFGTQFQRDLNKRSLYGLLLPLMGMSVWSGLEGIGKWIDKMATMCLVIIILLLLAVILWILSKLFGGGARG